MPASMPSVGLEFSQVSQVSRETFDLTKIIYLHQKGRGAIEREARPGLGKDFCLKP